MTTYTERTYYAVVHALQKVDVAIMLTPTGEVRSHICDANIHLLKAQELLRDALLRQAEEGNNV